MGQARSTLRRSGRREVDAVKWMPLRPGTIDLASAAIGSILVAVSLAMIWIARLSIPRDLYVSELGAAVEPTAQAFQLALLLLVAGASLIGFAARDIRSRLRFLAAWTPAVSLWAASFFFLIASQVTCTATCPLPWGATFSWQDLIHVVAAVLAFGAACVAMLQTSFAHGHRGLARFSLATGVAVGLIAATGGLLSVFQFATIVGSRLELVATTLGIAWVGVYGVVIAVEKARSPLSALADELEQSIREADENVDLVVVPLDPPALGLGGNRHEVDVLFPDNQGALST